MTQALDIMGDHGEFRITPEMQWDIDTEQARRFERALDEKLRTTPGLEINREDDARTGDIVVRWRTRL